jgi:hypothetical protein
MDNTLIPVADLTKKINGIARNAAKLTRDVQEAAVQAIGYSIEHGDITIGQRLFDALNTGIRRQALLTYFEKHGQFAWSASEKKFVFFKVEGIKFDAVDLMAKPWNEAKKEVLVTSLDVEAMVKMLIKKIESAVDKKVPVAHMDLYSDISRAYASYSAAQYDEQSDDDQVPQLKAA